MTPATSTRRSRWETAGLALAACAACCVAAILGAGALISVLAFLAHPVVGAVIAVAVAVGVVVARARRRSASGCSTC